MNENKSVWDDFTNMYRLSKTLRFELKPIGKTLEHIKEKGLIEEDQEREKEFNEVKRIMDLYYKQFIEKCLSKLKIEKKDLEAYSKVYYDLKKNPKDQKKKEQYAKNQAIMRNLIFELIKSQNEFKDLFNKEFIKKVLPKWLESKGMKKEKDLVSKFDRWTTYFTGFFDNRKNVFSKDEIPTSIIYRIVNDNLPKYLDNLEKIDKVKELNIELTQLNKELENDLEYKSVFDYITLENFNLFLNQSGIDRFNLIIGGKTSEDGTKIQGLNEYINLYYQKQTDKKDQKNIRKLKLIVLFKQILSDRESSSFIIEKIKTKNEVYSNIDEFYKIYNEELKNIIKNSIEKLKEADLKQVYVKNDLQLTKISQSIFSDWNKIHEGLKEYFINISECKTDKQKLNEAEKHLKTKYFSLYEINEGMRLLIDKNKTIIDYFINFTKEESSPVLFDIIKEKYINYKEINRNNDLDLNHDKSELDVEKIKEFLDSILELYHFIKPLHINTKKGDDEKGSDALEIDSDFYNDYNKVYEELKKIILLYNQVRNYVSQKPFKTGKFKLNFDNPDKQAWNSKFETNASLIFRKKQNGKEYYFLGIVPKKISEDILISKPIDKNSEIYILNYDFQKPDNKNTPRLFIRSKGNNFSPSVNKYNLPIEKIIEIYDKGYFKTEYKKINELKFKDSLIKLIDYFKEGFMKHESYKHYKFKWKESERYDNIADFYHDVEVSCYNPYFTQINLNNVMKLVDEGKLYLFQIWNKDFSEYSKGNPNLHTIYWRELFSEENLKDVVYKLNGEAELFYREKSIEKNITHQKGNKIDNKNPIKSNKYPDGKKTSTFTYDLIKDKRYTEDKFLFHCPITINFKAKGNDKNVHKLVNKHINKTNEKINILGIDRGERNLAYYTLIDSDGKILKQKSFNIISDDLKRELNYQERLNQIEGDRDKARKNWKKISNIKEMKIGYLSQVIHEISKIAIENNAIIVLEDLNFGFKRGRFKIEKQIYQKFEKMLIDKLNYLVFKDINNNEKGGRLNAYQLANKFESFQKLGKQSGIIYYVDAYKTSKICPKTGFVNMLYPKFENIDKSKQFIQNFEYIKYNKDENLFELNFSYSKFSKADNKDRISKDNWSIWSNGIKLINKRDPKKNNQWCTKEFDATEELKKLFNEQNIEFFSGNDLKELICTKSSKDFFESLIFCIKTILQLRNSYLESEVKLFKDKKGNEFKEGDYDYILSCVKDKSGSFFDSREAEVGEIKDADANGAYHIALKGLMLIDIIKKADLSKKSDLKIDRNEFLNYVVERAV
jgi:CRISPR-associated protein Cpf1